MDYTSTWTNLKYSLLSKGEEKIWLDSELFPVDQKRDAVWAFSETTITLKHTAIYPFFNLKDNLVSFLLLPSSNSINTMTLLLCALLTNVDLRTVELFKFSVIWNAEHIHILPKGLLCILIFYAFYSSKREKKQVEVIEAARWWWHPFHCNDSHDLRFCLALLCLRIANLQVATATLYTDR